MKDEDDTRDGVLTRAHLRRAACRASPAVSREDVRSLVDDTLEEISNALVLGDSVKLSGFGVFNVRSKPERIGRNPRTGVEATIAPRRVVTFKPSPVFKELVNGDGERFEKSIQAGAIPSEQLNAENDE
jgi:integration host factor subunit alpha